MGLPIAIWIPERQGGGALCTTTICENGVCRQAWLRELPSVSLKRPAPGLAGLAILSSSRAPCVGV